MDARRDAGLWQRSVELDATVYEVVAWQPGLRACDIAAALGCPRSSVARALGRLEARGYYLCELDDGRLYLWTG